jgi:hypothetical protein
MAWAAEQTCWIVTHFLMLGFQLDLYAPSEYCMLYWYLPSASLRPKNRFSFCSLSCINCCLVTEWPVLIFSLWFAYKYRTLHASVPSFYSHWVVTMWVPPPLQCNSWISLRLGLMLGLSIWRVKLRLGFSWYECLITYDFLMYAKCIGTWTMHFWHFYITSWLKRRAFLSTRLHLFLIRLIQVPWTPNTKP